MLASLAIVAVGLAIIPWQSDSAEPSTPSRPTGAADGVPPVPDPSEDSLDAERQPVSPPSDLTIPSLRIRVLDVDSTPVEDAAIYWIRTIEFESAMRVPTWQPLDHTDASGRVTVSNVESLVRQWRSRGGRVVDSRVGATVPGASPVIAEFDVHQPPENEILLRLPSTGKLRVELPLGLAWPDSRLFLRTLSVHGEEPEVPENRRSVYRDAGAFTSQDGADRTVFEHVGCGARFRLQLVGADNVPIVDQSFAGPARPGEELVVRPTLNAPVLQGRLIDDTGQALGGLPLAARGFVEPDAPEQAYSAVETRSDGSFRIAIPGKVIGETIPHWEFLTDSGPAVRASCQVARPLPATVHDLGDLIAQPLPVLVAGRCVDDTGAPVADPALFVDRIDADGESSGHVDFARMRVKLGANGEFTIRSLDDAHSLRVRAKATGHLDVESPVTPTGTTDLLIVLERGGRVTASALTETPDGLWPILVGTDAERHPFGLPVVQDGRAHWEWTRVPPGRYRFELRLLGAPAPIKLIHEVEVAPGETRTDPRLTDLPLDGVTVFRVDIHGSDGEPLSRASGDGPGLLLLRTDDGLIGRPLRDPSRAVVMSDRSTVELAVWVPRFRPASATRTTGDVRILLRPAPRIRVRLPATDSDRTVALRGGLTEDVRVLGRQGLFRLERWPGLEARRPRDGVVEFAVPGPGAYAIEVSDGAPLEPRSVTVGSESDVIDVHLAPAGDEDR